MDSTVQRLTSLATFVTTNRTIVKADKSEFITVRWFSETQRSAPAVTVFDLTTNYFWCMDPSVHFLMGNDASPADGATIHSIVPAPPVQSDDDKIGFTLDVTMRLDQEQADGALSAVIVPIAEGAPDHLADSA